MQGYSTPSLEQYILIWLSCQANIKTLLRIKEGDRDPKLV